MRKVMIVAGSTSDEEIIGECVKALNEFGVEFDVVIASAHRSPSYLEEVIRNAEKEGVCIFIAIAGKAAHLPGVIASKTVLPVIGVPAYSQELGGIDALLSISQMPKYVPVATVSIGKTGGYNAGILAVSILSICDDELKGKLLAMRKRLEEEIKKQDEEFRRRYKKSDRNP